MKILSRKQPYWQQCMLTFVLWMSLCVVVGSDKKLELFEAFSFNFFVVSQSLLLFLGDSPQGLEPPPGVRGASALAVIFIKWFLLLAWLILALLLTPRPFARRAIVDSLSLELSGELKVEWELNVDLLNVKLNSVGLLSDSDNVFFIFLSFLSLHGAQLWNSPGWTYIHAAPRNLLVGVCAAGLHFQAHAEGCQPAVWHWWHQLCVSWRILFLSLSTWSSAGNLP